MVAGVCCNFAQSFSACCGLVIHIIRIAMSADAATSNQSTTIPEIVIVNMVVFWSFGGFLKYNISWD